MNLSSVSNAVRTPDASGHVAHSPGAPRARLVRALAIQCVAALAAATWLWSREPTPSTLEAAWMAASLVVFLAVPACPMLGCIAYCAAVYGVARFDPLFDRLAARGFQEALAALALSGWLARVWCDRRGWPTPRKPLAWLMVAFLAWIGLTVCWSWATGDRAPILARRHPRIFLSAAVLFAISAAEFQWRRDAWLWGLTLTMSQLARAVSFPKFLPGDGDLALLVVIALPLAVCGWWLGARLLGRASALGAIGIALWLLWQTRNRGAVVGLLAAAVSAWLALPRRRLVAAIALPLLLGSLVVLSTTPYWHRFAQLWQQQGEGYESAQSRLALWKAGWHMFLDHPLLGVGPGNFANQVGRYVNDHALAQYAAHSHVFTLATETGLPGLILWALLFGGALATLFRTALRSQDAALARVAAMFACALVAYLAAGFFITRHDLPLAFGLVGAACSLSGSRGES